MGDRVAAAQSRDKDTRLAARAILICLVILGHNKIFRDHYYYTAYLTIYSFHVGSFFLLAVLSPPRSLTLRVTRGLLGNTVQPFIIFTLLYGLLYFILFLRPSGETPIRWVAMLFNAIVLANTTTLDAATGLKLLWFLPAFFVFCLLYNLYGRLSKFDRLAYCFVAALAHLFIGAIPVRFHDYIPWDVNISLYLIAPALIFRECYRVTARSDAFTVGAAALFFIVSAYSLDMRYHIILSDFNIYDGRKPLALFVTDLQLILGAIICLNIARHIRDFEPVRRVGELSLLIYLIHPLINVAAYRLLAPRLPWPTAMIGVALVTLVSSIVLAILVDKSIPKGWIFGGRQRDPQVLEPPLARG